MSAPVDRTPPAHVIDRILDGVAMGPNGCIVSTLAPEPSGYVRVGWGEGGRGGRIYKVRAHRATWIAMNGPIADDLTIHHRCFNRRCMNVRHMELLSNSENARRQGASRNLPDDGSCIQGHGPEHRAVVSRSKYGGDLLACTECKRMRYRNWYAQNRERRSIYYRAWYQRNRP